MEEIKIIENYDFKKIVDFFIENELEYTEDDKDEVKTDFIKSFSASIDNKLIGSIVLAKREGEYICDGIAVDKDHRKLGLGELLLKRLYEEVRNIEAEAIKNGKRIFLYLVARAPKFFEKNNFIEVVSEENNTVPTFFECKTCPQYNKNCFPKVMKKDITEPEEFCGHDCDSEKVPDETLEKIKDSLEGK